MRKVNFAVGNEVTCRHCYILTGKFMFTLHQEPIQEKWQNQDTPLLKSKTIHGCKKTKINVSCLAQEETFELLSEKGDPTFNLWFVQWRSLSFCTWQLLLQQSIKASNTANIAEVDVQISDSKEFKHNPNKEIFLEARVKLASARTILLLFPNQ